MYADDYLYHHGILGQKWGIRRYQNEDGSLTVEGTKHYGYGDAEKADERERMNRVKKGAAIAGGIVAGLGAAVVVGNTLSKDEKDMNALDKKIYGMLTKTDAGKNIVDELRRDKDGMFNLDADYVIPKGTTTYHVGTNPNGPTHQGKWMSLNKSDADFYKGVYTKIMDARSGSNSDKYQSTFVADNDIKGAGKNTASKVFMNQYRKDKALRETFWDRVNYHTEAHPETLGNMRDILAKADANRNKSIRSRIDYEKKMRDIGYDFFNIGLTDHGPATSKITKTNYNFDYDMGKNFYNDLSKKGYGSIRDLHDLKYSTFHTRDPQIMFNTDRDLRKLGTRKISKEELDKTARDTALVYASRLAKHHTKGKGGRRR